MVYGLILKVVNCGMRLIRKRQEGFDAFLSGFLAGFISICLKTKKSRITWGLFFLARSVDAIYNSLLNKGYIKKKSWDYIVMFGLCNVLCGYCFAVEPGCNNPGLNKFYGFFANEDYGDVISRHMWTEIKNKDLAKRGIPGHSLKDHSELYRKILKQQ